MGYQIIKQPDDLYAVFCSHTDTIVVWNASDEDIVDWFAEIAAERAREDARRILAHVAVGQPERAYHQFAMSWEEALEEDRDHEGEVWNDPDIPQPERSET